MAQREHQSKVRNETGHCRKLYGGRGVSPKKQKLAETKLFKQEIGGRIMKNWEKYEKEIKKISVAFGIAIIEEVE